jgi:hypothetical protein
MTSAMFRWIARVLLVSVLTAVAPAGVNGQGETTELEDMKIDLWPEYDRPSTLVMYRFRLKPGADLSVPVAIPIPSNVGEPHAVAWKDEKGSLFISPFTRRDEEDRAVIVAQLGSREGQLEFYADIDVRDGERLFRFAWPGGIDVGSLSFQVQRPSGATGLRVAPNPNRQWEGEDGLSYALVELGPQAESSKPTIEVRYEKDTAALSAPPAKAQPPTAVPAATTPESKKTWPSWLVAAGGIAGGILVFALLSTLSKARLRDPEERPSGGSSKSIFCHECGTEGRRSDSFCMNCGARLATKRA